jgi:hypothetical protein
MAPCGSQKDRPVAWQKIDGVVRTQSKPTSGVPPEFIV